MPDNTYAELTLSEHAGSGVLLAQRGLFAGTSPIVSDDLYAKTKGFVKRTRFALHLERGTRVTTNTYFGRFAASYWQRWTTVTEVTALLLCVTTPAMMPLNAVTQTLPDNMPSSARNRRPTSGVRFAAMK